MEQIKTIKNRIMAIALFMLVSVSAALAQAQTAKHIVERGETLETIAQKYGVTKDDIVKLNPDAAQFVYVGMELVVPTTTATAGKSSQDSVAGQRKNTSTVLTTSAPEETSYSDSEDESKWNTACEIGYGFIPKPDGAKGSNFTYEITVGATYKIIQGLYTSARIGYNSAIYNYHIGSYRTSEAGMNYESQTHFVEIPLEIGYKIQTDNQEFAIIPFGGFDFHIGVSGKTKLESNGSDAVENKQKIGGKIAMGARLGCRLRLWSFNISGAYHFSLNDNYKGAFGEDAYPEISVGWGF